MALIAPPPHFICTEKGIIWGVNDSDSGSIGDVDSWSFNASCKRCHCIFYVPSNYVRSGGFRPHCWNCRGKIRDQKPWMGTLSVGQKISLERMLKKTCTGITAYKVFSNKALLRIILNFNKSVIDHSVPGFYSSTHTLLGQYNFSKCWADEEEEMVWNQEFPALT